MKKINQKFTVAALLCGLFIIFAAPQRTSAQFIPDGSYKKTCIDYTTNGAVLSASCNPKSGSDFKISTSLADYFECDGSIWNDNGTLKCNRNTNSALMQKAKAAIDAAYRNVYGETVSKSIGAIASSFLSGDSFNYTFFLRELFDDGYAQKFYDGNLGGLANLGLIPWFQTYLSKPANADAKSKVINRAFFEVYNYGPSPKDMALYTPSLTGFQTIVLAEQKKLNADKVIRRLMISAAYKSAMGRNPTAAEYDYWQPKQEYFKQIVEASRAFLYGGSVKGSSDLAETVKRALNKNGNNPKPDIDQINKAITKYSQTKAIYDEMK